MAADADAASLRKDVESMQATIKHLQNAVDAKSTTIGILSKASREGGDLEAHITNAVQTKYAAIIKAKDDEIMMLASKAAKASEARPSVAMQEVREALQKSLNEYRDRCKVLEKDKKELTKTLKQQEEQLANVGKDAQSLEAMRGMVAELENERDCLKRTQQELLESLQQERAELEKALGGAGRGGGADLEAIARLEGDLAEALKKAEEAKLKADAAELRASQAADAKRRAEEEKKEASEMASQMRDAVKQRDALEAALKTAEAERDAALAQSKGSTDGRDELADVKERLEGIAKEKAEVERQLAEAEKKASEMTSQMRDLKEYQMRAIELSQTNDGLAQQLDQMTQDLEERNREFEEMQQELNVLQADRDGHLRIAKEQIDSRVQEVRKNNQAELQSQLAEKLKERQEEQRQLKELSEEVDKLRLTCDSQQAELKALRQAVGDTDSRDQALSEEKLAEVEAAPEEVKEAKREKARSLRALSKFAFDEMSERMAEQRRELEGEKRKLQSDFEQKIAERSARIVELSNSNDSLQTQVETLERARDSLTQQRDEFREKARQASDAEAGATAEAAAMSEANAEAEDKLRALRDHLGCSRLVYALHRGVVAPAFQIFTSSLRLPEAPAELAGRSPSEKLDKDADIDASTMDGTVIEDGFEDEEEEDDDEGEENTYGLDPTGEEDWAEMLKPNTLDSLFAGAVESTEYLSQASTDLQEHVNNLVSSVDMFPLIYADTLSVLDRAGKGNELRNYITFMQRAMARLSKLCEAVEQLKLREEEVIGKLQNCVRVKGLEWNLRSLRTAGQYEVLLRLQRNQLRKKTEESEDVLDQFGEKCSENEQLKDRVKEFEKQAKELEARANELEKQKEELQASAAAPKSMADIQQKMDSIERETIEKAAPPVPKPKGKGKGPPLPGAKAAAEAPAEAPAEAAPAEAPPAEAEAPKAKGPPKGPGKGKKGPPLPGQGPPPAPPAPAEAAPAEATPEPAPPEEAAAPKPAAKGKGKAKGPPPPGAKAAAEAAAAAEPPAEPAAAETAAAAPAKGPGKGKKGPPPPGAKAAAAAAAAAEPAETAAAPAAPSGKGPPPPGGKGPPPPGGKGPPPPGGKGPPPPGGKGPAPPGGKGPAPPAAPGGKGPAAPAAPGGKAGPAPKAGKGKGGKNALPPVDPGPEPPKDLAPKAFQWAGIQGNRFATSIFARLLEDKAAPDGENATAGATPLKRVKLNLDALTVSFFTKKKADTAKEAKPSGKKKTVATCLDSKRSQAVEIFLNGAGVKLDQVKACLVDLDEKAVAIENLQRILEFYPNSEEVPLLKEFQQENDPKVLPWGRGEEFMISLMSITDFKVRGECCQARGQFGEEFSGIAQDVTSVKECLSSLVSSTALPAIFGMVMQIGNYLNFGTNRGASRGFSLDSLQVLARVEGFNDKTYTLMRFLMDSLESDRGVRDDALDDMKLCDASSKIDVDDAVARLGKLEGAINQVFKYVKPTEGDPKVKDDKFNSNMSDFATQAQEKITDLKAQVAQVADLTKQCCDMFAEKPKTPSGEFLAKFALFKKHMEDARRENLLAKVKKEKAQKKRAEKENQPKKDNTKTEEAAKAKPKAAPASAPMRQIQVKNPEIIKKAAVGSKQQARIHGKESSSGLMVRGVDSNGAEEKPASATLDRREAKSLAPCDRAALLAGMGAHVGDAKDGPRPSLQVSRNGRVTVGLTGLGKVAGKEARMAAIESAIKQQQQEMQRPGASSTDKGPA